MNFFIATVGRSGSVWLSSTLNRSATHTVLHEVAEPHPDRVVRGHSPFPIERFCRPNYGEVHGYLRYSLSPNSLGAEQLIPRRGVLRRDTRAVISSWMNRDGRVVRDLGATIHEVVTEQKRLDDWAASDPDARVFHLEELTDPNSRALEDLCSWLKLDYVPSAEDKTMVKNANPSGGFEWNDTSERMLRGVADRLGLNV